MSLSGLENPKDHLVLETIAWVLVGLLVLLFIALGVAVVLLLAGCGTEEPPQEGFVCMHGTEEECIVVAEAEEVARLCGLAPRYTEFWIFSAGDEECRNKIWRHDKHCGYRISDTTAWIRHGCREERCQDLPKYVYHESAHKEWYEEALVVAETNQFLICWEERDAG